MAKLVHEIWEEPGENGQWLEGVCLGGPDGDGFRKLLPADARLVLTFEARSHFEAMTFYYRLYDRGPYTTIYPQDHEPYSDEMAARQRKSCLSR